MKYFSFVLWMIGYLFVIYYGRIVNEYFLKKSYSKGVLVADNFINLIIWGVVGWAIFNNS